MRRFKAIVVRVVKELLRDKRTLALMLVAPILILTMLYFVFDSNTDTQLTIGVDETVPSSIIEFFPEKSVKIKKYTESRNREEIIKEDELDAFVTLADATFLVTYKNEDPGVTAQTRSLFGNALTGSKLHELEKEVQTFAQQTETTIQQIPMGYVRNRAFAIVPNTYRSSVPHGLLLLFSEAGPSEPKSWSLQWEKFAAANRWIVVVLQSADEQEWTFEEMEIAARAKGHALTNYTIDRNRIVVGGIASGAVLGIITAVQQPGEYQSLWVGNGKLKARIRLTPPEPGESLRFFLNGTDPSLKDLSENVNKAGYNVNYYEQDIEPNKDSVTPSPVLDKVQKWLQFQEIF